MNKNVFPDFVWFMSMAGCWSAQLSPWYLLLTQHLMGPDLSLVLLTLGLAWARMGNTYRGQLASCTAWLEGSR